MPVRLVELKVGNGHSSAEKERRGTREQADHDQHCAEEFNDSSQACLRHQVQLRAAGHSAEPPKQDHRARLHHQEAGNDSKDEVRDFTCAA